MALGAAVALAGTVATLAPTPLRFRLPWVDTSPPVFETLPIPLATVRRIEALGHQAMPGNLAGTGQILLEHSDPTLPVARGDIEVRAPAAGRVKQVQQTAREFKIEIDINPRYRYYVDRIMPEPWAAGDRVERGDLLGYTSEGSPSMDFGLVDQAMPDDGRFANSARYPDEIVLAVCPLDFYPEPLRSELAARVVGASVGRCGTNSQDLPGRVRGMWFHESVPPDAISLLREHWPRHLAITRPAAHPETVWVAFGAFLEPTMPGMHVADAGFRPEDVSPRSGPVCVPLTPADTRVETSAAGVLWLEMTDDSTLRASAHSAPATCATTRLAEPALVYRR
jgi:hypothetical protein